jgi:hypothetical protein
MGTPYQNQHYVPESYLQGWTYDGTDRVTIFLTDQQREIPGQNITDICSSDYFNSEYTPLERAFGALEGAHATPLRKIREGEPLCSLTIGERRLLLSFVFTQRMRSGVMRDEIEGRAEAYYREALEQDIINSGHDPDNLRDFIDSKFEGTVLGTHHMMMVHGIVAPFSMHGLKAVILENESEEPFIASEAPIVFENPRFKEERGLNYPGLAFSGLQIYCPISPTHCALFYDPDIYRVEQDRRWHATIDDERDAREINMLQVFGTDSFIMYKEMEQEGRIKSLIEEAHTHENWEELHQEFETPGEEGEMSVYSSVPPHQLHDLVPTPSPVRWRPGTFYTKDSHIEKVQKSLRDRIFGWTEFSERGVILAIVFLLKSAGFDPRDQFTF